MRPARIISALFYGTATGLGIASAWFAYFAKYDIAAFCASMSLLLRFDLFETKQLEREKIMVSTIEVAANVIAGFLNKIEREKQKAPASGINKE